MKITITENDLYKLFEDNDVDNMMKVLDAMGLDGQSDFVYDSVTESFLKYLLGVAVAHSSAGHLSNYMLNQLILRISVCCNMFQVSRLATIAADIRPGSTAKVPENIQDFLTMDTYSNNDIQSAIDALNLLNEQNVRALLRHFADEKRTVVMYPPLCFSPPIIKRIHICNVLPDSTLLAIMAAALFEVKDKKSFIQRLTKRMTRLIG